MCYFLKVCYSKLLCIISESFLEEDLYQRQFKNIFMAGNKFIRNRTVWVATGHIISVKFLQAGELLNLKTQVNWNIFI